MRRLVYSLLPLFIVACGGNSMNPSATGGSGGGSGSAGHPSTGGVGGTSTAGAGGSATSGRGGSTGGAGGDAGAGGSGGEPTEADAGPVVGTTDASAVDAESSPPASDGGPSGDAPAAPAGMVAGTHSIFDGTTLTGWDGNPAIWSVKDGAIHGITQNGGQLIKSKDSYDNFRIVGSARMLGTDVSQHLGICIWGAPAAAGSWGYSGCVEFTPGSGSYWDYGKCGAKNQPYTFAMKPVWSQFEILANLTTKKVRVAINGHEVPGYTDCAASGHKKGPIGLQIHAHASEVEYKDLAIDPAPTEDKMLTVAAP